DALAHPVRRRLLDLLVEGERPVHVLAARFATPPFAMSRPAISQHLRTLLEVGLVAEQRAGRERRYRLQPERLRSLREWLRTYERFWRGHLAALGDYPDEETSSTAP